MQNGPSREIGGYLELERFAGPEAHPDALALNCARNCLAYLIEARGIKTIWVPWFICTSVEDTVAHDCSSVRRYGIEPDFRPRYDEIDLGPDDYLYLVDHYGQLSGDDIGEAWERSGGRLVVDEVMAFFRPALPGVDTIWSCRKFFGVADGAYLSTTARLTRDLETDESHDRMGYVLGRFERPAGEYYDAARANNSLFANEPIKLMSPLTHDILRAVDYQEVARRREENFAYLAEHLGGLNSLRLTTPVGPFMYPLLIEDGRRIRKEMQRRSVFVPTLWPNVISRDDLSGRYANDILPLPIDQRYGLDEMRTICDTLSDVM